MKDSFVKIILVLAVCELYFWFSGIFLRTSTNIEGDNIVLTYNYFATIFGIIFYSIICAAYFLLLKWKKIRNSVWHIFIFIPVISLCFMPMRMKDRLSIAKEKIKSEYTPYFFTEKIEISLDDISYVNLNSSRRGISYCFFKKDGSHVYLPSSLFVSEANGYILDALNRKNIRLRGTKP